MIVQLYETTFQTISLYLTKLFITHIEVCNSVISQIKVKSAQTFLTVQGISNCNAVTLFSTPYLRFENKDSFWQFQQIVVVGGGGVGWRDLKKQILTHFRLVHAVNIFEACASMEYLQYFFLSYKLRNLKKLIFPFSKSNTILPSLGIWEEKKN